MSDLLPQEILTDIFLRLPNKAIGTCMCTCKSWFSLIKDPTFVSYHLDKNKTISSCKKLLLLDGGIPNSFLLIRTRSREIFGAQYSLYVDDGCFTKFKRLVTPQDDLSFLLVGSCNGLVCFMHSLYTSSSNTFRLWNPVIRKSVTLPEPGVTFESHGPFEAFAGFGFDSRSNDYKVLRIIHLLEADDEDGEEEDVVVEAEIFSLNRNSWKNITHKLPRHNIVERGSQAFVNGAVHWFATQRGWRDGEFRTSVLALNVETEQCHELALPEPMAKEDPRYLSIFIYKDSTIAVCRRKYIWYNSDGETWVMKEYGILESWKKLFVFGHLDGGVPWPLGFRREGAMVFQLHYGDMVSIHPEGFLVQDLGVQGASGYSFLANFKVTLALLDK